MFLLKSKVILLTLSEVHIENESCKQCNRTSLFGFRLNRTSLSIPDLTHTNAKSIVSVCIRPPVEFSMCEQDGGEHGILVILIGSEELLALRASLVLSDQLSIIGNRRYATNTILLNRFHSIADQCDRTLVCILFSVLIKKVLINQNCS